MKQNTTANAESQDGVREGLFRFAAVCAGFFGAIAQYFIALDNLVAGGMGADKRENAVKQDSKGGTE